MPASRLECVQLCPYLSRDEDREVVVDLGGSESLIGVLNQFVNHFDGYSRKAVDMTDRAGVVNFVHFTALRHHDVRWLPGGLMDL
jgi:hypothetical protein